MSYAQSLIVGLIASQAIAAAAIAGERRITSQPPTAIDGRENSSRDAGLDTPITVPLPLDRVATAVDGAESSHGTDTTMWRPDPSGPQGPMQVSEAAATDVGGGDRFDLAQNRAIGRAYLAQLYARYRNWPDAIAAYNWGLGNVDAWVRAGRPSAKVLPSVGVYLQRVLHESGLCEGSQSLGIRQGSGNPGSRSQPSPPTGNRGAERKLGREAVALLPDSLISAACSAPDGWVGAGPARGGPGRLSKKLDQALQLAMQRARQGP